MVVKVTYNISNPFISVSNQNPVVYIKVAYGSGGGSSSVVWGAITGTLSDQVDLQNALDEKVDDTTTITINGTTQDLSTDRTWNVGDMLKSVYDTDDNGIVDKAEKMTTICRNSTGATIYKGTIVYLSGSTGNRPNILKAIATSDATSAQTFGVVIADIANNSDGEVATLGTLDNLDTRSTATHPFTSDTLADGDILYLSPTTAGFITNVKPYAPYHIVYVGMMVRTSPTNGTIVYRIQNGYELDELHNVSAQTPSNNDGLFYESSTSLWKNKSIATILGYTPANASNVVPNTRTLTINGTAYDLSADRSWTTPSGTITSVAMTTPTGLTVTGSPITTSGTLALSMTSGYAIPTTIKQSNWDDAYTWVSAFPTQTGNSGKYLTTDGSTLSWGTIVGTNIYNTDGTLTASRTLTLSTFSLTIAGTTSSRFFSNGNVVIGGTTDAGYKADVQGTLRVTGLLTIAGGTSSSITSTDNRYLFGGSGSGTEAIKIGQLGNANGNYSIALQNGAIASALRSIAIGTYATATGQDSISLGGYSIAGANEFQAGGFYPMTNVYFGSGSARGNVNDGVGSDYTINGSGARGVDFAGGNITIAGGKGTGAGTPGDVIISTATATTSGSTVQTLTNRARIKAGTGQLILNAYTSTSSFSGTVAGLLAFDSSGNIITTSAAGSGTVTTVSVVSVNGFAGTVANATTTPAITLTTSITGVLKGNGTAISAATAGTDYQAPITLATTGTTGDATFSSNTLTIPKYDSVTTNRQTASYTLVLGDRGKLVEMNVASANTMTVPLNSSVAFAVGTKIDVTQYGAGATTITATSGVTIRSLSGYLKLAGQYAACTIVKIGTDEWYCYGNLIA